MADDAYEGMGDKGHWLCLTDASEKADPICVQVPPGAISRVRDTLRSFRGRVPRSRGVSGLPASLVAVLAGAWEPRN